MLLVAISLLTLFTLLLFLKRPKKREELYLILWYASFALQILGYHLKSISHINQLSLFLIYLRFPILLCYPPLFFLYQRTLRGLESKKGLKLGLFSPAIVFLIYYLILFIINGSSEMASRVVESWNYSDPVYIASRVIFFISFITLFILSKAKMSLKSWSGLFSITAIILFISSLLFGIGFKVDILYLTLSIIMSILTLIGFRQPTILYSQRELKSLFEDGKKIDYDAQLLLKEKLDRAIIEDKVYRDKNLTLELLSDKSDIPQYLLTQILNRQEKKSFPDYINDLRLKEFISLYKVFNNTKTVLEIADMAGFPSKPTFYRVFKNKYGCSPKNYFKQTPN